MLADPPHVRQVAFIYVMRRADGIRKVGCSFDPDHRRRQLSNEMEIEYRIEKEWEMDTLVARAVERAVHKAIKPHKHRLYEKIEYYKLPLKRLVEEVQRAHAALVGESAGASDAAKKLKLSRVQVIKRWNRIRENEASETALKIGDCNGE